jgi:hypothetical protein
VEEDEAAVEAGAEMVPEEQSVQSVPRLRQRRRVVPHAPNGGRRRRSPVTRRYPWAELLRRVFEIEVFVCPHCGGARRLLAAITAPEAIEKVLRAMGPPSEVAELSPARAPPGGQGWWGA